MVRHVYVLKTLMAQKLTYLAGLWEEEVVKAAKRSKKSGT